MLLVVSGGIEFREQPGQLFDALSLTPTAHDGASAQPPKVKSKWRGRPVHVWITWARGATASLDTIDGWSLSADNCHLAADDCHLAADDCHLACCGPLGSWLQLLGLLLLLLDLGFQRVAKRLGPCAVEGEFRLVLLFGFSHLGS